MAPSFELAANVLAAQPFSAALGTKLVQFGGGRAELELAVTDLHRQQFGFVHGGVLAYLADNALTFAGGSELGPEVLTVEMKINYLRPARGPTLVARAVVVNAGKALAVCRCDLFDVDDSAEALCAIAQGTVSVRPRKA